MYWYPGSPHVAIQEASRHVGKGPGIPSVVQRLVKAGLIYRVGVDADGNEVFAAGFGRASAAICLKASRGILEAFPDIRDLRMVGCSSGRGDIARRFYDGAGLAGAGCSSEGRKMNVFYHCYGSAHSSVVTAAIHLGLLPASRIPTVKEVCALPWFDRVRHNQIGAPYFVGEDSSGVGVFILGLGPSRSPARGFLRDFVDLCGLSSRIIIVDCLPLAGAMVRVGGFMSRRIGAISVGRFIAATGIRRRYWEFVSLACHTRLKVMGPAAGPAEGARPG